MKCPHCSAKIGVFSKAMNQSGKTKNCPHCGHSVKLSLLLGRFFVVFLAMVIVLMLLGLNIPIACGISGVAATILAMALEPA